MKKIFQTCLQSGDVEAFALANDASVRTGLTALHTAASRGYIDIVMWCQSSFAKFMGGFCLILVLVIEECGAIPDLEDKEGEVCI